jgi:putative sigma-54 modulation protein
VLSVERHRHVADITLHARGEKFLHGVGDASQWEQSLGDAVQKITQQAQKVKGKWKPRVRNGQRRVPAVVEPPAPAVSDEPAPPPRSGRSRSRMPPIFRATRQSLKPMSIAEATRSLNADGDGIVIFRDEETATVSVLYRRRNGDLALVQADV